MKSPASGTSVTSGTPSTPSRPQAVDIDERNLRELLSREDVKRDLLEFRRTTDEMEKEATREAHRFVVR